MIPEVNNVQATTTPQETKKQDNAEITNERISVFLDDEILSTDEQKNLLSQMVSSDSSITKAKEFGFNSEEYVQKLSETFDDIKINKKDNEIYNIKMNYVKNRLTGVLNSIKSYASKYMQMGGQSEDITDANGLVTQTNQMDRAGNVYESIKYEYDDKGNIRKHTTEDAEGNLKSIREYNENGTITNKINHNEQYTEKFDYDENGSEIRRTVTFNDGTEHVFEGNENKNNLQVLMLLAKKVFN